MTGTAARAALNEFVKDLERVEQLLGLIHDFRDFASKAPKDTENGYKLWTTAKKVRTDLPLLSGSLLLYLCGRFEYFVRELVGSIVDELVDGVDRFDDLPAPLRKEYLIRTLAINQNPGKFGQTVEAATALAAELASNLAGNADPRDGSLRVDAAAITITESNMNPGTMVEIFKRVGVVNLWETLGKQSVLKSHLGEAADGGCKAAAVARLEEIMSERNRVAHPTGDILFPDAEAVLAVAQYFRVLAPALVELALVPR